ncbi:MAG: cytochrome P450 [Pseudobdellovibrionaceae bacterium]
MKRMLTLVIAFSFIFVSCTSGNKGSSYSKMEWDDVFVPGQNDSRAPANDMPVKYNSSNVNFIKEIQEAKDLKAKIMGAELSAAVGRMKKIFEFARTSPRSFFGTLRRDQPIFESKGAKGSLVGTGLKEKAVPNIYIVTKFNDVQEVLNNNNVFTVAGYKKAMDATVGGAFMLGRDNEAANFEKPHMRHALYGNPQDPVEQARTAARVRAIVKSLALRGIKEGTKNGELDVVKSVTRSVPLGLNDEFFGFNGPTQEDMAKWSRATQHAFFHNPFQDPKVFNKSVEAGKEMNEYIKNVLLPNRKMEFANGRPAIDTVSRIIRASQSNATHGLYEDRIVANVIGLLVGSVETTSAAITQALQILLSNGMLDAAIEAAKSGNDKLFDGYVWEALRFDPVNPWLARYSTEDYVLGKGKNYETTIPAGSLVLASTESAMFDEEVVREPHLFKPDRDKNIYMHLGYAHHRCLGDDVSLVMVPETLKQILLLPGIQAASLKPLETEPFPETYVVTYTSKKDEPNDERNLWQKVTGYVGLAEFFHERVDSMSRKKEAKVAIKNALTGDRDEKRKAIKDLPDLVVNATEDLDNDGIKDPDNNLQTWHCLNTNPKSKEAFENPIDRKNYCEVGMAFRGCYFIQRLVAKQSSYASYYHCAYTKDGNGVMRLNPKEREDFNAKFKHLENFYFLNFENQ